MLQYNKFNTFVLLLLVVIKLVIVEKNQIPAAAVWLDRENVPIKMFKEHQTNIIMFKIQVFRPTVHFQDDA